MHVAAAAPFGGLDDADEHLVLRLRRRERAEVVLAAHELGRLREPLLVERPRVPPRAPELERRRRAAAVDAIPIRACDRGVPRVEVVGRRLRTRNGEVARELRVQGFRDALGRRPALDVGARDLRKRMNAPVGPARDRESAPPREDVAERTTKDCFDCPQPRLDGPSVEAGAVVLER